MNSERMDIPLVLACDEAFAMPLATTLRSIVDANPNSWPLEFHVLLDSFSDNLRKKVFDSLPSGSATIRWIPVDMRLFREFSITQYQAHCSKMTYARLLIPHSFPETVSRILYLDADLLVLDDLRLLSEKDLEGAVVGAVLDATVDPLLKYGDPRFKEVPRVRDYFNAGVLLIDLLRWRKERISEKALEYHSRHPRLTFSDQDALNVVCDGIWKKLDERWNFQNHWNKRFMDMSPGQLPAIVHFVSGNKPWNPCIRSLNASFYETFRNRTCFARTRREKCKDVVLRVWSRLKCVLKRYAFLRTIWGYVGPSRKNS